VARPPKRARVVGEEHGGAFCIATRQRRVEILGALPDEVRVVVVDPREVEGRVCFADGNALVPEHPHTELAQKRRPGVRTREVIVIARDEENPVARAQVCQGRDLVGEEMHAAVHHVARNRDEVGFEGVDACGGLLSEGSAKDGTDVEIAHLNDAEAVERPGPALDLDPESRDPRRAKGRTQAKGARRECDQAHRDSAHSRGSAEEGARPGGQGGATHQPEQRVAREQQVEQQKPDPHPQRGGPGDAARERQP